MTFSSIKSDYIRQGRHDNGHKMIYSLHNLWYLKMLAGKSLWNQHHLLPNIAQLRSNIILTDGGFGYARIPEYYVRSKFSEVLS